MSLFSKLNENRKEMQLHKIVNYAGGHPSIDKPQKLFLATTTDKEIHIRKPGFGKVGDIIGKIHGASVKNVIVEDKTTVTRRIGVTRLLLVGVFALAWKKKQKNNDFFVVIEWNDGRFDHETLFEYEGPFAMKQANELRNYLLRNI